MTILQALYRYYDRMEARGEAIRPGYSWEPIGLILVLSSAGELVDIQVRRDPSGRKPKPELVPKWFGRAGNGSTPYFLWDNSAYVLGVGSKDPGKTNRDHAAFKALHFEKLMDETDAGLVALRRFLDRWTPNQFAAPRFDARMMAWNIAFALDGEQRLIHERAAAGSHVEQLRTGGGSAEATFCLVTGRLAPPVRLHPKIKGVDGTASAEVPLASFNESAFESYGKSQGFNAPTSEDAAFKYSAALNRLLDRGTSRNRMKIADATLAFWADASGLEESSEKEDAAKTAEDWFGAAFNPPASESDPGKLDRDEGEAVKVRDALDAVAKGRPLRDASPKLAEGIRFYVLGLAPNIARLSVRYWLDDRFEVFAKRLADHYADLAILPAPWRNGIPSVQRLLVKTTALQEKFDKIPHSLAGEVMRAILTGTSYPRTLLTAAIIRLRAGDDPTTGWHAAAIRAVLAREHRLGFSKETSPMSLNPDSLDPAYQLGRLFAVYERAQQLALGNEVKSTIRDKYYGAASSTPAFIFPLIDRNYQNHISKLRKENKGLWIEREVGEIARRIGDRFPRSLKLEDQGRFALGYYHQRWARANQRTMQTPNEEGDGHVD